MGAVPHDKLYPYLEDADIFLTASGGEGVSVSVLEAFASGLPVICFKVRGLEGQVDDGETGVFAKDNNARAFYNALLRADKDRTRMSYRCLERAREFDSKVIAERISKEIQGIIK